MWILENLELHTWLDFVVCLTFLLEFLLLPPLLPFILFSNRKPTEMLFKLWHSYSQRRIYVLLRIKDKAFTIRYRALYNLTPISSLTSSPTSLLLLPIIPATLVFWLVAEFHVCCLRLKCSFPRELHGLLSHFLQYLSIFPKPPSLYSQIIVLKYINYSFLPTFSLCHL